MKALILFSTLITINFSAWACIFDGNETLAGTLSPTTSFQTQNGVSSGDYFTINVSCGDIYTFSTCDNGGSASWDTQITILGTNGITEHAYNDDNCGTFQSNISWTADFSGTIYVLISEYSCDNTGGQSGATLAYAYTPASLDPSFTIASTSCNTASSTITGDTGGTFSFNPLPGDGAVINSSTGQISNATAGASYTVEYMLNCNISSTETVTISSTGDASFYYTETCAGGIASITGNEGGTFIFNPNLGDGAQLNATSGALTNGVVGTTYTIEYSVCGTSSTQDITALDNNCFTLNGDAQYIDINGEPCIELTQAINSQTGCAWNSTQIDFANDFTLSLDYYFGNNINGADGNTFTFQPSSSSSCGVNGDQLGAGSIPSALVIEFDTYDNGSTGETWCDHVAIEIDGDLTNGMPLEGPTCAKNGGGNIDDGGTYAVDIAWNASTQLLEVYFDGSLRLSTNYDFVNNLFGGQSQVYWGATSATGGLNNQQYFCPSSIVILPVELISFKAECVGGQTEVSWTTASEERVAYFQLEYTYDGLIYYPVDEINAIGTSTTNQNYSIQTSNNSASNIYYRLKIVDQNEAYKYSDIISASRCNQESLITSVQTEKNWIKLTFKESVQYELMDGIGRRILYGHAMNDLIIDKRLLSNGIYHLRIVNNKGEMESKKLRK